MDTTKNETTTNIVLLAGLQRNGSAMIGLSFHDLEHVTNVADIFMTNKGPLPSLRHFSTRWREHILESHSVYCNSVCVNDWSYRLVNCVLQDF
jgi:hypothetical protein